MSSADMDFEYASDGTALVKALETVHRPGSYFSTGIREVPMPTVDVEGLERLSFPVSAAQAETLIRMAAEKAPFGRGEKTVLDESVRKVWQVPLSAFTLSGNGWNQALKEVLDQVRNDLGCGDAVVEAELYKLLVYAEDGHFKAHRDTEKAGGMFGTLVITLPSAHTGGNLRIRHADQEVCLDLCPLESAEIRFAAFFADCEHEVEPIKDGNRICLVYNLLRKKGEMPSAPADDRMAVRAATKALRDWAAVNRDAEEISRKIVYLLEHKYTESALSFQALKGEDAALARVLRVAAEQADFDLHLAMVHIEDFGYFEEYYDYGYEPDEFDMDDAVVEDREAFLDSWCDAKDEPVGFGKMRFDPAEDLLPPGALDDEPPDEENYHGNTGNAGASFDRAYLRAALVLWPKADGAAICLGGGLDCAIGFLESRSRPGAVPLTAEDRDGLGFIAEHVVEEFRMAQMGVGEIPRLLISLQRLGFDDLLQGVWRGPLLEVYDGSCNSSLVQSLSALPLPEAESCMAGLFERYAICLPRDCLELWTFAAARFPEKNPPFEEAFRILLENLPEARQGSPGYRNGYEMFLRETLHPWKWAVRHASREPKVHHFFPPEMLSETLNRLLPIDAGKLALELLEAMRANRRVFSIEDFWFPAFLHVEAKERKRPVYELLWQTCAEALLERSETPPPAPTDWVDSTRLDEKGETAEKLQAFLQDPNQKTFAFRATQDLRVTMESLVQRYGLDLDLRTEKKGRPHTLHLTKNRATYQKALQTYGEDQKRMREMITPPERVPEKHRDLAERCRVAS
ncbi:MAG: 2OG-Fe(II) oxygenase [Verrucomicrobia bacterium]|nr:2OG-Fe(II) oxygenase [Verrucomicrobiota bacterium]